MVRVQVKRLQRGLFCRIGAISRVAFSNCIVQPCEASRQCCQNAPSPQPLAFSGPPDGFAEPPAFRLSRDVCDGTSNRKPATVAVNLLRPRRGGRAVNGVFPRGAPRGRRSSSFHAASGRSSGPRHRELSRGYGDWLRCSDSSRSPHAPARSVPPWQGLVGLLAACAGRAPRAERGVGEVGGCPIRRLGALASKGRSRGLPGGWEAGHRSREAAPTYSKGEQLGSWVVVYPKFQPARSQCARVIFSSCGNADAHRGT